MPREKIKAPYSPSNRTTTCTECGGEVKVRRPSRSGEHYCRRQECQAAKQRSYRERRSADKARLAEMQLKQHETELLAMLGRIAVGEPASKSDRENYLLEAFFCLRQPRQPCASCGREDAVAGLPHPAPDLRSACRELQLIAPPQGLAGPVVFSIWPEMLAVVQQMQADAEAAEAAAAKQAEGES